MAPASFFSSLFGAKAAKARTAVADAPPAMPAAPPAPANLTQIGSPPTTEAKPWQMGLQDRTIPQVLALTGTPEAEMCIRCKYSLAMCNGAAECMFDSNCFYAGKELKCRVCLRPTLVANHLVTKMCRGPYEGLYLHQWCARTWYEANPRALEPEEKQLIFQEPPFTVTEFFDKYLSQEIRKANLDMVGGGGKSNNLIYLGGKLRALGRRFVCLVFGVKARGELQSRGFRPSECFNFHSYFFKLLSRYTTATLSEDLVMTETKSRGRQIPVQLTVVYEKTRLVVSFFFNKFGAALSGPLTKLYRPFITQLSALARTHAFGAPNEPTYYDAAAMMALVSKYRLVSVLEMTWTSYLTQPEKLTIEHKVGSGAVARLEYGIIAAGQVLALGFEMATSREVDGKTSLYNEVRRKTYPFPCIDQKDMEHVPTVKELDPYDVDDVLVDEKQDMNICQLSLVKAMVAKGAGVVTVGDFGQSAYLWSGIDMERIVEWLTSFNTLQCADNYRSGDKIIEMQQEYYQCNMTISGMSGFDGLVATGTFFDYPIDLSGSTMVIGRKALAMLMDKRGGHNSKNGPPLWETKYTYSLKPDEEFAGSWLEHPSEILNAVQELSGGGPGFTASGKKEGVYSERKGTITFSQRSSCGGRR